ncbi:MAG: hypothetical protein LBG78_06545, partial [Azoarcus sp.]|nr:hypothetical protein [Azoarcus sp.]
MNLRISNPQERHFDSATLTALARRHATIPLRRAGALTELLIVGIADCLAGQPDLPTLVLAGSQNGALAAGMRLLSCIEIDHEEPYPFDFLASQPIIAAVALQKSFPCIENTLYQPWHGNAELHWQRAHTLA